MRERRFAARQGALSGACNPSSKLAWRGDYDGDDKADNQWHNTVNGENAIWKSGDSSQVQVVTTVMGNDFKIAGSGDFDGDGKADILWRNATTGQNAIWKSGDSSQAQGLSGLAGPDWTVVSFTGLGAEMEATTKSSTPFDFTGDGKADFLLRNVVNGQIAIWGAGDAAQGQNLTTIANLDYMIAGVADYDGDGKADILWRNTVNGAIERQLEESVATFGQSRNGNLIKEILDDARHRAGGPGHRRPGRDQSAVQAKCRAPSSGPRRHRTLPGNNRGLRYRPVKVFDASRRTGAWFQSRIAAMNGGLDKPYTPNLPGSVVAEWQGVRTFKSESFEISEPFWRLDVLRKDLGIPGKFAVTVYLAETDQPFTRITNVDYLQMRVCVLDGPGRY